METWERRRDKYCKHINLWCRGNGFHGLLQIRLQISAPQIFHRPGSSEEIASIFGWFQKWCSVYTVCCVCCTIWIGTNEQLLSMWDDRISNRIGVVCIYLEKMSLWNSESSGTVIRHLAIISLTTYTQFLFKLREKSSYYKRTYGHWWGLRPDRALSTEIKWLDRLFIYLSGMKYKKNHKTWFLWQRPCWCPS